MKQNKRKPRIAIIAHDNKKAALVSFVMLELLEFQKIEIVATGTTGNYLESAGLTVEKKLSGPYGGDAQIAAEIVEEKIDGVIFFMDPLAAHPHEVDVQMLLRICNVHNVPIATNPAAAKLMVHGQIDLKKA